MDVPCSGFPCQWLDEIVVDADAGRDAQEGKCKIVASAVDYGREGLVRAVNEFRTGIGGPLHIDCRSANASSVLFDRLC